MRLSCLTGPPMTYVAPRHRYCQSQEAEADRPTYWGQPILMPCLGCLVLRLGHLRRFWQARGEEDFKWTLVQRRHAENGSSFCMLMPSYLMGRFLTHPYAVCLYKESATYASWISFASLMPIVPGYLKMYAVILSPWPCSFDCRYWQLIEDSLKCEGRHRQTTPQWGCFSSIRLNVRHPYLFQELLWEWHPSLCLQGSFAMDSTSLLVDTNVGSVGNTMLQL